MVFLKAEPPKAFHRLSADDIMASPVCTVEVVTPLVAVTALLRETSHSGFPVVAEGWVGAGEGAVTALLRETSHSGFPVVAEGWVGGGGLKITPWQVCACSKETARGGG